MIGANGVGKSTFLKGHIPLWEVLQEKHVLYSKPDFSNEDGIGFPNWKNSLLTWLVGMLRNDLSKLTRETFWSKAFQITIRNYYVLQQRRHYANVP